MSLLAAEPYHPHIRRKGLRKLRAAEKRLEAIVRHHLRLVAQQAILAFDSVALNFAETPEDSIGDAYGDAMDGQIDPLQPDFAQGLSGGLGPPMDVGGGQALDDIPGIEVDWSLQHPEAQQWIATQSLALAQGLSDTTKASMRTALVQGLRLGESRDAIADRLVEVGARIPKWRARLIAQTEVIRAYSEGTRQVYQASGVVEKIRWLDGQPGACPTCRAHNDTVRNLDGEGSNWTSRFGTYHGPPAHPGCRCAIAAVVEVPGEVPAVQDETVDPVDGPGVTRGESPIEPGSIDDQLGVGATDAGARLFRDNPGMFKSLREAQEFANLQASYWFDSSTGTVEAVLLQRSASLLMMDKRLFYGGHTTHWSDADDAASWRFTDAHRKKVEAYVKAQYEETQARLKAADISTIELHRGMSWETNKVPKGIRDLKLKTGEEAATSVTLNPLSSFSDDYGTAEMWTMEYEAPRQFIVSTTVPAERIFLREWNNMADSEYVVLGGSLESTIARIN